MLRSGGLRDTLLEGTKWRCIMQKVNVTCRLDKGDVAFLDKLAQVTDRDRSYLIKKAVAEYIDLQRWQIEEVEKAIGEADAGQFATDKEVRSAFNELRK
jgi:RHH-type rel operon transcriptional repressor/antitoxin RelB